MTFLENFRSFANSEKRRDSVILIFEIFIISDFSALFLALRCRDMKILRIQPYRKFISSSSFCKDRPNFIALFIFRENS